MPPLKKTIFATPIDVENAFYEAMERGDLEAIMAVWAEDEEAVCVHPGGPRLLGYRAIREAWAQIFSGTQRMHVRHTLHAHHDEQLTAVHSVLEEITVDGNDRRAPVVATNVYIRGALGWRLLLHHASPAPPDLMADATKTLH